MCHFYDSHMQVGLQAHTYTWISHYDTICITWRLDYNNPASYVSCGSLRNVVKPTNTSWLLFYSCCRHCIQICHFRQGWPLKRSVHSRHCSNFPLRKVLLEKYMTGLTPLIIQGEHKNTPWFQVPYFSIDNARVIYTKKVKIRKKNEHTRYTLGMKKGKNLERLITATSQARF